MKFKAKRKLSKYDVPVASLRFKPVYSSNVVQLIDYSASIPGNTIASVSEVHTKTTDTYSLDTLNIFGKIQLTDKYYGDKATGSTIPLWYLHTLQRPYYNNNVSSRLITKDIRHLYVSTDRIISSIVPTDGNMVIVQDSIKVKNNNTLLYIDNDSFWWDTAKNNIRISDTIATGGISFDVSYDLLPLNIEVETYENSMYLPNIERVYNSNTKYYHLRFLSTSPKPMKVWYMGVQNNEEIDEFTGYTLVTPIFNEVVNSARLWMINSEDYENTELRVFSYNTIGDSNYISVTSSNSDRKYTFRPEKEQSTKIKLLPPDYYEFSRDWFIGINTYTFDTNDGRTFSVADRGIVDTRERIIEKAEIISSTIISLSHKNIQYTIGPYGDIQGIEVYTSDGKVIDIESVNNNIGVLYLQSEVSKNDDITVHYAITKGYIDFNYICLNPLPSHSDHNYDIRNNVLAFFIIDSANDTLNMPIAVKVLPLYNGNQFMHYDITTIGGMINSQSDIDRETFRADMVNLPPELVNSDTVIETIGIAYLTNPLDTDGYIVEDMRIYGGGTKENNMSFHEYSLYDGEATDLELFIKVHMKERLFDDLVNRILEWDPDVLKLDNDKRADMARQKAHEMINKKINKFTHLGTASELIIDRN